MTEIETQWKVVKDCIRALADQGPEAFKLLPARGPELEAVHLRACGVELKKYNATFRCFGTGVPDEPEDLVWPTRPDTQRGQLVWNVDRIGSALRSEEVAQAILEQLKKYCTDYERELQSFYD